MNTLQYLMLCVCAAVIVGTPYQLLQAVKRKQKHRFFEVPISAIAAVCLTVYVAWPSVIASTPRFVHLLIVAFAAVWAAEWFGVFRWLFNRQKVAPIERR